MLSHLVHNHFPKLDVILHDNTAAPDAVLTMATPARETLTWDTKA